MEWIILINDQQIVNMVDKHEESLQSLEVNGLWFMVQFYSMVLISLHGSKLISTLLHLIHTLTRLNAQSMPDKINILKKIAKKQTEQEMYVFGRELRR